MRSPRLRFACAWALAALFALPAGLAAQTVAPAPAAARAPAGDTVRGVVADSIDRMLARMYPPDEPGAAVLIVKDGRTLLRRAYGLADVELGVPMRPGDIFRIGSMTKQFTAVAILKLVAAGKLSLDDDIRRFLPDYPTHGRRITIEELLTHTSGIRSYTSLPQWASLWRRDLSLEQLIALFENEPPDFAPGTSWAYDNSGYVLLGDIIEKASGLSYEEFLRRELFQPLGLAHTSYDSTAEIVPGRVPGYSHDANGLTHAAYLSMTQPFAAGALMSNVDDLARWNAALAAGRVVPPALLEQAWRAHRLPDGRSTGYGFGWFVTRAFGRRSIEHGGDINGFAADGMWLPGDSLYIVVLQNVERGRRKDPSRAALRAAAILLGVPFSPPTVTLPTASLDSLVGVYRVDGSVRRVVTRAGEGLRLRITDGPTVPLVALAPDTFFVERSRSHVYFRRGDDGRVSALVLQPRLGPTERSPRTDEAVPPPPAVAHVAEAVLRRYVGRYEVSPQLAIVISYRNGALYARPTGRAAVKLVPRSDIEFALPGVGARIQFTVRSGRVIGLLLHQAGHVTSAHRVR